MDRAKQKRVSETMSILDVRHLTIYYDSVRALEDVSFSLNQGEIVALLGPNGAGKSTALKSVAGLSKIMGGTIRRGEILLAGTNIEDRNAHELVSRGVSLVPEGRHIFPTLTVIENLQIGAYLLRKNRQPNLLNQRLREIFDLFPNLINRQSQKAGTLSSGEQQMLAIGRALMLKPKVLLADEPSLGLSPNFVDFVFEKLVEINQTGVSILLVEQNIRMALRICHRAYVFDMGSIISEGAKDEILQDERIRKMLFGEIALDKG